MTALGERLRATLAEILKAALEITGAQMGNIQTRDGEGGLTIAVQAGFEPQFLEHFSQVDAHTSSACGAALAAGQRIIAEDIRTSPVFANTPSMPVLLAAGVKAVQSTPLLDHSGRLVGMLSTHYREPHAFDAGELRRLDVLVGHAGELLECQHENARLERTREELERNVAERTQWLNLMHEISRAITEAPSWDEALRLILRRVCEVGHWQIGHLYLRNSTIPGALVPVIGYVADKRLASFHALSQQEEYAAGMSLPERVFAEGLPVHIDDPGQLQQVLPLRAEAARQAGLRSVAALPVVLGREVIAVLELFSDEAHPPSEPVATVQRDVTDQIARVLERERVTARMAELLWREQQDLLHTLHDSLGQTLTGLGMLSRGLSERLARTDAAAAETAQEIARQAKQALGHVRQLTKSLFPVEVESENLTAALRDLAAATQTLHGIPIRVEGTAPKLLRDGRIATQLYRIAQEAVTNAVRHAQAHTITIRVGGDTDVFSLQIADDGVGMRNTGPSNGMGLKIMRYRAHSIGGRITIESSAGGGTLVTCTVRPAPQIGVEW